MFCLVTLLDTLQEQPSLSPTLRNKKFVRQQTTCRLLSRFFFCFSKLKLSICFSSRKVSHRDSSTAAFLLGFDSLTQALMADFRKNPLTFQIFNYSCSSTAATKWNTAAIKILLLFEAGLFIWFFGWGKRHHVIQRKWMLNMQTFTAVYRNGFWPHVLAIRRCI